MMNELISYNDSLMLREFGFDEACFAWYSNGQLILEHHIIFTGDQYYMRKEDCNAPTFSQAFRFFREKFNLFSCVELHLNFPIRYYFIIDEIGNDDFVYHTEDETIFYDKYEDAEIACLKLLIELVKNKSV
jgi:hypothetical protein